MKFQLHARSLACNNVSRIKFIRFTLRQLRFAATFRVTLQSPLVAFKTMTELEPAIGTSIYFSQQRALLIDST